jgi:hypothetical protein
MGGYDTPRLSIELRHEMRRVASHPLREVKRLEHEAELGENAATLAILVAAAAIVAWALVAIIVVAGLAAAALLAR